MSKLRTLILTLAVAMLTALGARHAFADDWFRIRNVNTLITASQGDLKVFMSLNAQHQKNAVRTLYRTLENRDALFNIQPGTLVHVVEYYRDGTARIEWGDGAFTGYINMADLSEYLGSE